MTKIFKKRFCVFKNFRKENDRAHSVARFAPDRLPAPGCHLYTWLLRNYFGPFSGVVKFPTVVRIVL